MKDKEQEQSSVEEETTTAPELELKEKNLRLLAELENMRKRLQKEKQEAVRFATENIILEFLPIIDGFEQALKFSTNASEEVSQWASGFQMFFTQLKEILHNHGVVAFHSEGNQFDPYYHEAVEILETDEHSENTILEEFIKGYKSKERILRPAKVKVAKAKVIEKKEETKEEKTNDEEE